MEFSDYFTVILWQLLFNAIPIVFWIAVIVFAAVMLRRGGGRAERFLIAGGSLNIAATLLRIPMVVFVPWLIRLDYTIDYIATVNTSIGICLDIISMAGVICLIYAFWVKFNARKYIPAASEEQNTKELIA
ncbi:hypothetical protein ACFLTB_03345 [Chloroflexota bacterium]